MLEVNRGALSARYLLLSCAAVSEDFYKKSKFTYNTQNVANGTNALCKLSYPCQD